MKTLFIVHIEDAFRQRFPENYLREVRQMARKCDRVIAFESLIDTKYSLCEELEDVVDTRLEWGWGYEPLMFKHDKKELPFVISAYPSAHEYTWIPPKLRGARQKDYGNIIVAGGAEGECLTDFKVVLDHVGLKYKIPQNLKFT